MPVPILGPEVGSDSLKVEFLMICGRPKIVFFGRFPGPRGTFPQFPLATNHAGNRGDWRCSALDCWGPLDPPRIPGGPPGVSCVVGS